MSHEVYHLRRVGPASSRPECAQLVCFDKNVTIVGRNREMVDFLFCSANHVRNSCISRRHARIVKLSNSQAHRLHDDSRNGIFINDIKMSGSVELCEGDVVTFGHPYGEKIAAGTRIRQPDSEFQYIFEVCTCKKENIGSHTAVPIYSTPHGNTVFDKTPCRPHLQGFSSPCPIITSSPRSNSTCRGHIHTGDSPLQKTDCDHSSTPRGRKPASDTTSCPRILASHSSFGSNEESRGGASQGDDVPAVNRVLQNCPINNTPDDGSLCHDPDEKLSNPSHKTPVSDILPTDYEDKESAIVLDAVEATSQHPNRLIINHVLKTPYEPQCQADGCGLMSELRTEGMQTEIVGEVRPVDNLKSGSIHLVVEEVRSQQSSAPAAEEEKCCQPEDSGPYKESHDLPAEQVTMNKASLIEERSGVPDVKNIEEHSSEKTVIPSSVDKTHGPSGVSAVQEKVSLLVSAADDDEEISQQSAVFVEEEKPDLVDEEKPNHVCETSERSESGDVTVAEDKISGSDDVMPAKEASLEPVRMSGIDEVTIQPASEEKSPGQTDMLSAEEITMRKIPWSCGDKSSASLGTFSTACAGTETAGYSLSEEGEELPRLANSTLHEEGTYGAANNLQTELSDDMRAVEGTSCSMDTLSDDKEKLEPTDNLLSKGEETSGPVAVLPADEVTPKSTDLFRTEEEETSGLTIKSPAEEKETSGPADSLLAERETSGPACALLVEEETSRLTDTFLDEEERSGPIDTLPTEVTSGPEDASLMEDETSGPTAILPTEEMTPVPTEILLMEEITSGSTTEVTSGPSDELIMAEETSRSTDVIQSAEEMTFRPGDALLTQEATSGSTELILAEDSTSRPNDTSLSEEEKSESTDALASEEEVSEQRGTLPYEAEISGPTDTLTSEEEISGPSDTLPSEEEKSRPKDTLSSEEEIFEPAATLPSDEEIFGPTDTLPSEEEIFGPTETLPSEEEISRPTDTLPSDEEISGQTDTLPSEEEIADTLPSDEEISGPTDTFDKVVPGPTELLLFEEETSMPADLLPTAKVTSASTDTLLTEEETSKPTCVLPTEELTSPQSDLLLVQEGTSGPAEGTSGPKDTLPSGEQISWPIDTLPSEADISGPADTLPSDEEASGPAATLPSDDEIAGPTDTLPSEEEISRLKDTLPSEEEISRPKDTSPAEEEISGPTDALPSEEEIFGKAATLPSDEEISGPTDTLPSEEEISGPTDTLPSEEEIADTLPSNEEISGQTDTLPSEEEIADTLPSDEEIFGPTETLPSEEEIADTLPSNEEIFGPTETLPSEEEVSRPTDTLPSDEEKSGQTDTLPSEEEIADTLPSDEEISGPTDTADKEVPRPTELLFFEEETSMPADLLPTAKVTSASTDTLLTEEETSGQADTSPSEEEMSGPVDTLLMQEETSGPTNTLPVEKEASRATDMLPLETLTVPEESLPLEETSRPEYVFLTEEETSESTELLLTEEETSTGPVEISPEEEGQPGPTDSLNTEGVRTPGLSFMVPAIKDTTCEQTNMLYREEETSGSGDMLHAEPNETSGCSGVLFQEDKESRQEDMLPPEEKKTGKLPLKVDEMSTPAELHPEENSLPVRISPSVEDLTSVPTDMTLLKEDEASESLVLAEGEKKSGSANMLPSEDEVMSGSTDMLPCEEATGGSADIPAEEATTGPADMFHSDKVEPSRPADKIPDEEDIVPEATDLSPVEQASPGSEDVISADLDVTSEHKELLPGESESHKQSDILPTEEMTPKSIIALPYEQETPVTALVSPVPDVSPAPAAVIMSPVPTVASPALAVVSAASAVKSPEEMARIPDQVSFINGDVSADTSHEPSLKRLSDYRTESCKKRRIEKAAGNKRPASEECDQDITRKKRCLTPEDGTCSEDIETTTEQERTQASAVDDENSESVDEKQLDGLVVQFLQASGLGSSAKKNKVAKIRRSIMAQLVASLQASQGSSTNSDNDDDDDADDNAAEGTVQRDLESGPTGEDVVKSVELERSSNDCEDSPKSDLSKSDIVCASELSLESVSTSQCLGQQQMDSKNMHSEALSAGANITGDEIAARQKDKLILTTTRSSQASELTSETTTPGTESRSLVSPSLLPANEAPVSQAIQSTPDLLSNSLMFTSQEEEHSPESAESADVSQDSIEEIAFTPLPEPLSQLSSAVSDDENSQLPMMESFSEMSQNSVSSLENFNLYLEPSQNVTNLTKVCSERLLQNDLTPEKQEACSKRTSPSSKTDSNSLCSPEIPLSQSSHPLSRDGITSKGKDITAHSDDTFICEGEDTCNDAGEVDSPLDTEAGTQDHKEESLEKCAEESSGEEDCCRVYLATRTLDLSVSDSESLPCSPSFCSVTTAAMKTKKCSDILSIDTQLIEPVGQCESDVSEMATQPCHEYDGDDIGDDGDDGHDSCDENLPVISCDLHEMETQAVDEDLHEEKEMPSSCHGDEEETPSSCHGEEETATSSCHGEEDEEAALSCHVEEDIATRACLGKEEKASNSCHGEETGKYSMSDTCTTDDGDGASRAQTEVYEPTDCDDSDDCHHDSDDSDDDHDCDDDCNRGREEVSVLDRIHPSLSPEYNSDYAMSPEIPSYFDQGYHDEDTSQGTNGSTCSDSEKKSSPLRPHCVPFPSSLAKSRSIDLKHANADCTLCHDDVDDSDSNQTPLGAGDDQSDKDLTISHEQMSHTDKDQTGSEEELALSDKDHTILHEESAFSDTDQTGSDELDLSDSNHTFSVEANVGVELDHVVYGDEHSLSDADHSFRSGGRAHSDTSHTHLGGTRSHLDSDPSSENSLSDTDHTSSTEDHAQPYKDHIQLDEESACPELGTNLPGEVHAFSTDCISAFNEAYADLSKNLSRKKRTKQKWNKSHQYEELPHPPLSHADSGKDASHQDTSHTYSVDEPSSISSHDVDYESSSRLVITAETVTSEEAAETMFDDVEEDFSAPDIDITCLESQPPESPHSSPSPDRVICIDEDSADASSNGEEIKCIGVSAKQSPELRETNLSSASQGGSKVGSILERIKAKKANRRSSVVQAVPETDEHADQQTDAATGGPSYSRPDLVSVQECETFVSKCREITCTLEEVLTSQAHLSHLPRVKSWRGVVDDLKQKTKLPETVIAVVGDTGAGKSSLMNALLDHAALLPTSGMRACTAVVVEISENKAGKEFEADIDFLSEKEWYDELGLLLTDLQGTDGQVKARQPDPQTAAGVAWSKIRAVYGVFRDGTTLYDLRRMRGVTRWLGKTKRIKVSKPHEFRKQIDRYIESSDMGAGGDYWPIVKHVSVRIPDCFVCARGATLVDLPGIRDSNAARDKIAKEFLKKCSAVWVVASIHRAVDDRTAKELLGEHFRRQLLMDGQYAQISFVCTKTDILVPSEIIRALDIEEQCRPLETEIAELEGKIYSSRIQIQDLDSSVAEIERKMKEEEEEVEELTSDTQDLSQALMSDGEGSQDEEAREQLGQLQAVLDDQKENLESLRQKYTEARNNRKQLEKNILEFESRISACQKTVCAMCARARNDYSTQQIRRDFKAGLREMKRQSGMDVAEDDDTDDDDLDTDVDLCSAVDKLQVFCVSSTEYLKLKKKLTKDGPATTFSAVEDTGVPSLQQFVHRMTEIRRSQWLERLARLVGHTLADIIGYLTDSGTQDGKVRSSTREVFDLHMTSLTQTTFPALITNFTRQVDAMFDHCLRPRLVDGANQAVETAPKTAAKWGAKVDKNNREQGGLHWSTYKAVCRRDGIYKSPTCGQIDFNEDLSSPVYTAITIVWNSVFNGQLLRLLDMTRDAVVSEIKRFGDTLSRDLNLIGMSVDRVTRVNQQYLDSANNKLGETVAQLKDFITERQREISRVINPTVQDGMKPAYAGCCQERGTGSFARMKQLMVNHVSSNSPVIFDESSKLLLQQLCSLQEEMTCRLQEALDAILHDMSALYEPLWEAPHNTKCLRDHYLPGLIGLTDSVRQLYELAKISTDTRELEILKGPFVKESPPTHQRLIKSQTSPVDVKNFPLLSESVTQPIVIKPFMGQCSQGVYQRISVKKEVTASVSSPLHNTETLQGLATERKPLRLIHVRSNTNSLINSQSQNVPSSSSVLHSNVKSATSVKSSQKLPQSFSLGSKTASPLVCQSMDSLPDITPRRCRNRLSSKRKHFTQTASGTSPLIIKQEPTFKRPRHDNGVVDLTISSDDDN